MEGDAKDVAREFLGRHEANVVRTKECGETILLGFVVHQVSMTLRQFNIILYAQGSNSWWVQGDETRKIEVQLDSNKPDLSNNWRLARLELANGWLNWWQWSCHLRAYQHCCETIEWLVWQS